MSDPKDSNPYLVNEPENEPVEEKVTIDPSELYGTEGDEESGRKLTLKEILFDPSGRLSRWTYFKMSILTGLVWWLAVVLAVSVLGAFGSVVSMVSFVGLFYAHIVMLVKRWHDMNEAGTSAIMNFIPLINIYASIKVYFSKGTEGDNDYGPEEKGGRLIPDSYKKGALEFYSKL